ncbi:serine/threonine-protein phosphatase 6 regulatory ankyrin repeat subunit A-like [Haliotis rufescens]|uniref:serine/threonine-protein phosphatase 6 regulatory ankyrin repeat subunit A-like n=1 Tax=Haliotis rufescens TaxID=6454 RepID=UPI00201F3C8C|nr:serine/threonine-protein phosphatase 6 regulatory ankyrin repeat subunit A-like [Haliotis rufescens]
MTPVLLAARGGYREVFMLCVCAGGNVSVVDPNGNNILHLALIGGHVAMVKYILSQNLTDIKSRGIYGRTPLMMAALKGYIDVFDLLVSQGGDASLVDTDDENILHFACIGGRVEMVKYILSQNIADVNSRGKYRRTPLMKAVGHRNVFALLVSKGGDASLVDKFWDNVLHIASRGGHVQVVEYVLSNNFVDVNSRRMYGRTPLMVAAGAGHTNVFDLLVYRGGNASAVDDRGSNILHVACFFGKVKMVMHIISQNIVEINSRGVYGRTPLLMASAKGNIELFDFLVSKGGNMSVIDENNDTILHTACLEDHVEMVTHILSQSVVDVNAKNKYGITAAMTAKNRNNTESYVLLMKRMGKQPDV